MSQVKTHASTVAESTPQLGVNTHPSIRPPRQSATQDSRLKTQISKLSLTRILILLQNTLRNQLLRTWAILNLVLEIVS